MKRFVTIVAKVAMDRWCLRDILIVIAKDMTSGGINFSGSVITIMMNI